MCRLIEQNGWSLKRVKGSHHIYSKPGERKVISIPVHGGKVEDGSCGSDCERCRCQDLISS